MRPIAADGMIWSVVGYDCQTCQCQSCKPTPITIYYYYFANAAVAVDSSHMTASSSASCIRFSLLSHFVNGHVSTMWFLVCRWPPITVPFGCTSYDAVWVSDSVGYNEPCVRWGHGSTDRRGTFEVSCPNILGSQYTQSGS